MIEDILESSEVVKSIIKGKDFIVLNSTPNRDKKCNQLYEATEILRYK